MSELLLAVALALDEALAFGELAFLAGVEGRDGAMVTHHAGPDFAGLAFAVFELRSIGHGVHLE